MESMLEDPESVQEMINSYAVELKSYTEGMISKSTISVGGTTAKKGKIYSQIDTLEKQSKAIDKRVADFEIRLQMQQASLEALYSNMESRISALTQQAAYISSFSNFTSSSGDGSSS